MLYTVSFQALVGGGRNQPLCIVEAKSPREAIAAAITWRTPKAYCIKFVSDEEARPLQKVCYYRDGYVYCLWVFADAVELIEPKGEEQ